MGHVTTPPKKPKHLRNTKAKTFKNEDPKAKATYDDKIRKRAERKRKKGKKQGKSMAKIG